METSRRRWNRMLLCGGLALVVLAGAGCSPAGDAASEQTAAGRGTAAATEAHRETMRRMIDAADGAFESVKNKDLESARSYMAQLSVLSTKMNYDGIATAEGMGALADTIVDAMRALNSLSPNERTVLRKVAGVRLAVDSLAHRQQPMWKEFRRGLEENLAALEAAAAKGDDPAASRALAQWRSSAELILPAIVIGKGGEAGNMLESMTAFLTSSVRAADWKGLREGIPSVRSALADLFEERHRDAASPLLPTAEPPQPALWSLVLGGFIVAALTYAGWKKYMAEKAFPLGSRRGPSNRP